MNIVLIDPQSTIANGVRCLSTRLRENNYPVRLIFEQGNTNRMICDSNYIYRYKQSVLDEIIEFCQGADLVGFSLMTNFFDRARQLTVEIKKRLSVPVVWGGIHPTMCPEESLEYADIVCIGEAENSLIELIKKMEQGRDYFDTRGFAFKKNGQIIKNDPSQLVKADEIPPPDYNYQEHWIISEGRLIKLSEKGFLKLNGNQLSYATSRGCPYKCSYCGNNVLLKLYPDGFLRARSLTGVVNELERIVNKIPGINKIFFNDDNFMSHTIDEFREFAAMYKRKVNLPFSCITTPASNEQKFKILSGVGLQAVYFGLQTVNENVLREYNRPVSNSKVRQAAMDLAKYESKIKINFDVILDSPFETDYERLNTIRFLLDLPLKFSLWFFSLTFYPGTALTAKAVKEGIIKKSTYQKCEQGPRSNLINLLFYFTHLAGQGRFPRWVVRLLCSKLIFLVLNRKILNVILYHFGQYRNRRRYYDSGAENYQ
ncbi:B12-binding domain-containing radical SAM protein [Candidatus Omnitrophota bacterium]